MKRRYWYKDSMPGPMRIDWIVRNDTLYKYQQSIFNYSGNIYGKLIVMNGNKMEWSRSRNLIEPIDLSEILQIISIWNDELSDCFDKSKSVSYYSIKRTDSFVTFKPNYDNRSDTSFYPEIQIWGTRIIGAPENSLYDE